MQGPFGLGVQANRRLDVYKRAMVALVLTVLVGCAGGLRIGQPQVGKVPEDAGILAIRSNVAGADVTIDGKLVGTIMKADKVQDIVIPAGEHELIVRKFGREDWKRDIYLTPGAKNTVDVYLERVPTKAVEVK